METPVAMPGFGLMVSRARAHGRTYAGDETIALPASRDVVVEVGWGTVTVCSDLST